MDTRPEDSLEPRLSKELGPADRTAIMLAVANPRIRAGLEQQARDFFMTMKRDEMQRRNLQVEVAPACDWVGAAREEPAHARERRLAWPRGGVPPDRSPMERCDSSASTLAARIDQSTHHLDVASGGRPIRAASNNCDSSEAVGAKRASE